MASLLACHQFDEILDLCIAVLQSKYTGLKWKEYDEPSNCSRF
jgi:hypothetical protein